MHRRLNKWKQLRTRHFGHLWINCDFWSCIPLLSINLYPHPNCLAKHIFFTANTNKIIYFLDNRSFLLPNLVNFSLKKFQVILIYFCIFRDLVTVSYKWYGRSLKNNPFYDCKLYNYELCISYLKQELSLKKRCTTKHKYHILLRTVFHWNNLNILVL